MINIIILIEIIYLIIIPFLIFRNQKVYVFRNNIRILSIIYSINNKDIYLTGLDKFYNKLPSYLSMTYSFKRIKLESYFTEEEIDELFKYTINYKPDDPNNIDKPLLNINSFTCFYRLNGKGKWLNRNKFSDGMINIFHKLIKNAKYRKY